MIKKLSPAKKQLLLTIAENPGVTARELVVLSQKRKADLRRMIRSLLRQKLLLCHQLAKVDKISYGEFTYYCNFKLSVDDLKRVLESESIETINCQNYIELKLFCSVILDENSKLVLNIINNFSKITANRINEFLTPPLSFQKLSNKLAYLSIEVGIIQREKDYYSITPEIEKDLLRSIITNTDNLLLMKYVLADNNNLELKSCWQNACNKKIYTISHIEKKDTFHRYVCLTNILDERETIYRGIEELKWISASENKYRTFSKVCLLEEKK